VPYYTSGSCRKELVLETVQQPSRALHLRNSRAIRSHTKAVPRLAKAQTNAMQNQLNKPRKQMKEFRITPTIVARKNLASLPNGLWRELNEPITMMPAPIRWLAHSFWLLGRNADSIYFVLHFRLKAYSLQPG
jgi:hypothetical protein